MSGDAAENVGSYDTVNHPPQQQGREDKVKRIVRLETGSHYWWRQNHERIWRVCYIGNDPDDNQWLHPIGSPPMKIADMDLSCFDWQEINQPNRD